MSNTTVAKGEVVIETAQPLEIARATRVGSAGRIGSAPRILPKKTAIIIGLTPRYDTGIMAIDNRLKTYNQAYDTARVHWQNLRPVSCQRQSAQ